MSEEYTMDLSPEERTVILSMRYSQMGGRAIYNYALGFDSYDIVDPETPPWRPNAPRTID